MLSYELALKLKESGFPQEYRKTDPVMDWAYDKAQTLHLLHDDNDTDWWLGNDYSTHPEDETVALEFVKCPTLSELLEACGEDAFELSFVKTNNGVWLCKGGGKMVAVTGLSPEEAVANLWLALNATK